MTATEPVLVTRPGEPGASLVATLAAAGIRARHVPLLEIQPCSPAISHLPDQVGSLIPGSLVVAVSRPAVRLANGVLPTWPAELQYWAVGYSTARQWQLGNAQPIRCPALATSEGLLAMPELQRVTGRQVLILRGCGGRTVLGDTLRQRGATVMYAELYQRAMPAIDGAAAVAQWQQAGISVLVATSGAILNNLQTLVPPAQQEWLFRCQLIVVSERLAQLAHAMGFTRIAVAAGADDHSLLACLKQVLKR